MQHISTYAAHKPAFMKINTLCCVLNRECGGGG